MMTLANEPKRFADKLIPYAKNSQPADGDRILQSIINDIGVK